MLCSIKGVTQPRGKSCFELAQIMGPVLLAALWHSRAPKCCQGALVTEEIQTHCRQHGDRQVQCGTFKRWKEDNTKL